MKKTIALSLTMLGLSVAAHAQVLPAVTSTSSVSSTGNSSDGTLGDISRATAELKWLDLQQQIKSKKEAMAPKTIATDSKDLAQKLKPQKKKGKEAAIQISADKLETTAVNTDSVTVLGVYGLSNNLNAELKVGDLFLKVKAGDFISQVGLRIKKVKFDSVVFEKEGKEANVFISPVDASAFYNKSGRNGLVVESSGNQAAAPAVQQAPVTGLPTNLPPLPIKN